MTLADHLFKRHRFDRLVMVLCVRWYLSYKLSYRDLVEMMAERGLVLAHTTIMRWVLKLTATIEQRWRKYAHPVGRSWRVDETYIKVKGRWVYLYRAVDKAGRTVDFYLSEHRDVMAAKGFFRRAILHHGPPQKITLDRYQASHRGVADLKDERRIPQKTEVRSCAYLNNIVEQDHRRVKSRTGPMLGFKRFGNASIVISGIELVGKSRKGQFNVARLTERAPGDIHDLWMAVLVAETKASKTSLRPNRLTVERGQLAPARFAVLFFERRRRGQKHSVSTEVSKACSDQLTSNLTFWHDRHCADAGCARTDLASMKNALRHLGPRDPRVPSREKRDQWIKEIAYYKAMNRRFIPGHELVDWLAAEQEVDALCRSVSMT